MKHDVKNHQQQILLAVSAFHYVTINHITDLLYSPNSKNAVTVHLKELFETGYLCREPIPRKALAGSSQYVYWLDTKARHYLKKEYGEAITFTTKYSYQMRDFVSSSHLAHCLEVTDFLIAASKFGGVARLWHDFTLRQLIPNKEPHPDGFIDFRISGEQICIWLEVDRGKESEEQIKTKLINILYYIRGGGYQRDYDTPVVTVAFVIRNNIDRMFQLQQWTQEVLQRQGLEFEADMFRFGSFTYPYDTTIVFTAPVWVKPFSEELVSLI